MRAVVTTALFGGVGLMVPLGAAQAAPIARTPVIVDAIINGIAYDPAHDVVYASVDKTDPKRANQILTVDADTGQVIGSTPVGTDPGTLAISDDGSVLYAGIDGRGTIEQFSLPSMTPGWTFTLGSTPSSMLTADDIEVMPGQQNTIVVSRKMEGFSPRFEGVVVIDSGVQRPNIVNPFTPINSIEFGPNANQVYGANAETTGYEFSRLAINASGISLVDSTSGLTGPFYADIAVDGGLTYVTGGRIINPAATPPITVDTLGPPSSSRGVAIDAEAGVVYFASDTSPNVTITGYDTATRQMTGQWTITGAAGSARKLTNLGNGRLAFQTGGNPLGTGKLVIVAVDRDFGSFGEYTPLTPERILDTRTGLGRDGAAGPMGPGSTIDVTVTGVGGVPQTDVAAVVMNVTAVAPTAAGFLTVFPTGLDRPTISNLNFDPNVTVANLVTMPVGDGGKVSVFSPNGNVDVLFDIAGYYATEGGVDGLRYHALSPARLMDTRDGVGGRLGALGTQDATTLQVTGVGGVPAGARAVALNVTVTGTTAPSFLSAFPSDVALPTVSNLNFSGDSTIANQVIVRLPANGQLAIFNAAGQTDVIVDVAGYYDDVEVGESGRYLPFEPFRYADTRESSPFDAPGVMRPRYTLYTPEDAGAFAAYVLNITVTGTTGSGYVTAFPYSPGATPPNASTLNYAPGRTVPNHAIVSTGPSMGFYNNGGSTHLIVDIFGAFI